MGKDSWDEFIGGALEMIGKTFKINPEAMQTEFMIWIVLDCFERRAEANSMKRSSRPYPSGSRIESLP